MKGNNIYIKVYKSSIDKIERFPIEEVVKMMVISQIDMKFHIELIKCQAIIARTQIVRNAKYFNVCRGENQGSYDIHDKDLGIQNITEEYIKEKLGDESNRNMEKLGRVIEDTKGLIITYNNKPIIAEYHNTCGGATENSENVTGNQIIYLRKVLCNYCQESPHWENTKELFLKDIEEKLNVKFPKTSPRIKTEINGFIDNIERDKEGRVKSIKIGNKKFKGKEVMEILGLDSTRFSVSTRMISFNTQGKGHGLGFCQYGGNKMAQEGYKVDEILKYYYTGIDIKNYYKPCINKPLSGIILLLDPAHGGEDIGAIGQEDIFEKDIVLEISKQMSKFLKQLGAEVLFTREEDEYLSLSKRRNISDERRIDFFITISLNSFPNSSINGCEIYHYRGDKDSHALSKYIMDSLVEDLNIVDRGVKTADFYLLKEVKNSAMEIFVDYITNPKQEKNFMDNNYIESIAQAIVKGIVKYHKY